MSLGLGSADDLSEFENASFHAVVSNQVIHHFPTEDNPFGAVVGSGNGDDVYAMLIGDHGLSKWKDHAIDECVTDECGAELAALRAREVTPREWFDRVSDGKLTDEDLSEAGNRFTAAYYVTNTQAGSLSDSYLEDYAGVFWAATSLYHVADTWTNFDAIAPIILKRYRWFTTRKSALRKFLGKWF